MNKNISESMMFDLETVEGTTAGTTSLFKYDMQDYFRAGVAVGVRSTGFTTITVDLMEATASTAAGSSNAAGRAGRTIGAQGGTGITTAGGVKEMTLTFGADVTAESYVLSLGTNQKTLTVTTATASLASTAQASTLLYVGSTLDSTAAGGLKGITDDLSTKLSNSTYGFGTAVDVSTNATNTLTLRVRDAADGDIRFSGGAASHVTITVQEAVVAFDLNADQMTTGCRWIGAKISTVGVAAARSVAVIRQPGRYMPSGNFKGYVST